MASKQAARLSNIADAGERARRASPSSVSAGLLVLLAPCGFSRIVRPEVVTITAGP